MKRGHSNVKVEEIVPWPNSPLGSTLAQVPLIGGASVATCREFPPLALHKCEWKEIGERMGWIVTTPQEKGDAMTIKPNDISRIEYWLKNIKAIAKRMRTARTVHEREDWYGDVLNDLDAIQSTLDAIKDHA